MEPGNMETLSLPKTKSNGSKIINGHSRSSVFEQNFVEQKVADWIVYCLQTKHDPPLSQPLTIHLNVLLGTKVVPETLLNMSFQVYQTVIEQLARLSISETIMPSLYIPLECTESLIAGPIDAQTLVKQINYNEPPSLYLTERDLATKHRPIERYNFPLQSSDFLQNSADVYVYYMTWRTLEDIENGWEYGRAIIAEYYPEKYR